MHSRRGWLLALVFVASIAGCGQDPQPSSQVETPAQGAPMETTAAVPDPAAPGWVAQVRQAESRLVETVEQGRLAEVHDQAGSLQGVLKQVADQAGDLSTDQRQQLTQHLAGANRLVDEMHHAADANDLAKTKSKVEEFRTHLRAIEGVFGVPAP